jgi:hypothetical protein
MNKWRYDLARALKKKYLKNKTIGEVQWKPGDSHFWSGLMKVKYQFLEFSTFNLHNGTHVRFWEDKWFGNVPLKDQYPCLYNITEKSIYQSLVLLVRYLLISLLEEHW